MLTLNDGRSELWQWDTGRTLAVDADCSQVHFSNKVFGRSIDVDVADGVAIIPDILLQTDKELNVWAFVGTAENGYTKISKTFKVNRRNKPADYVFTPQEQILLKDAIAIVETAKIAANDAMESAKQAEDSSTQAAKSADAAADSATAAKASEDAAAASEDNARISAGAAAVSEGNAAASADKAKASETAAAESASNASKDAAKAASAAKKAADESVAANIAAIENMQADVASKQTAAAASENAAAASAVAAADSASAAAASEQAAAQAAEIAQDAAESLQPEVSQLKEELAKKVPKSDYAPEAKTDAMTQPVGKDSDGKLWTAPGSGTAAVTVPHWETALFKIWDANDYITVTKYDYETHIFTANPGELDWANIGERIAYSVCPVVDSNKCIRTELPFNNYRELSGVSISGFIGLFEKLNDTQFAFTDSDHVPIAVPNESTMNIQKFHFEHINNFSVTNIHSKKVRYTITNYVVALSFSYAFPVLPNEVVKLNSISKIVYTHAFTYIGYVTFEMDIVDGNIFTASADVNELYEGEKEYVSHNYSKISYYGTVKDGYVENIRMPINWGNYFAPRNGSIIAIERWVE